MHLDHATDPDHIELALKLAEEGIAFDSIMVDASHADVRPFSIVTDICESTHSLLPLPRKQTESCVSTWLGKFAMPMPSVGGTGVAIVRCSFGERGLYKLKRGTLF